MAITLENILGKSIMDSLRSNFLLGNSLEQYLIAFLIFLGLLLGMYLIKVFLLVWLRTLAKKTVNKFDDALVDALIAINWPFFILISLLAAIRHISIVAWIDVLTLYLTVVVATFYAVKVVKVIIVEGTKAVAMKKAGYAEEVNYDDTISHVLATIAQVIIWIGVLIFVLDNAGVNISAALAGIGIGGIAIAFALQNVLGDIFASFSIYFDKPFKKGDFLVIGSDSGTVQKIGIKSTRIKTLQGQELVVSNKELTESRINNFKKLERRRAVFSLGVTYDTPSTKLKKIPGMIKKIFAEVDKATLDRVHFKEFADSSLNFEVVYYVNVPDYEKYMDVQEKINFKIKEKFDKEKLEFAFPSRTIYLQK